MGSVDLCSCATGPSVAGDRSEEIFEATLDFNRFVVSLITAGLAGTSNRKEQRRARLLFGLSFGNQLPVGSRLGP